MEQPSPSLRQRLEYALFACIQVCLRVLPSPAVLWLGRRLGDLWRLLDARHRKSTRRNLALALPELSDAERGRILRDSFRAFGANALDTLRQAQASPEELAPRVDWEGWENYEEAQAAGKGVCLLAAHHGSFEIGAWAMGGRRPPVHLVTRRLRNPLFDARLREMRGARGIELVEREQAIRSLLRALRGDGRIGFSLDQRVHPKHAIEASFFGQRCFVSFGLGALATKTGAPVVSVTTVRDGGRYRMRFKKPIWPQEDSPQEILRITQLGLDELEASVREDPELWTWQHRLWRESDADKTAYSRVALALQGDDGEPGD